MELKFTDITVAVKLDEKTFKRFARFDMFALRKKWAFSPASIISYCIYPIYTLYIHFVNKKIHKKDRPFFRSVLIDKNKY